MAEYKTEQEHFWANEFGDAYIDRNPENFELGSRLALFAKILGRTSDVRSVIEFGANIGNNLKALASLLPKADSDLRLVFVDDAPSGVPASHGHNVHCPGGLHDALDDLDAA